MDPRGAGGEVVLVGETDGRFPAGGTEAAFTGAGGGLVASGLLEAVAAGATDLGDGALEGRLTGTLAGLGLGGR